MNSPSIPASLSLQHFAQSVAEVNEIAAPFGVRLISIRPVLHRGDTQGERVAYVHTIETRAGLVEVDIWMDTGKVSHVGHPRPVSR